VESLNNFPYSINFNRKLKVFIFSILGLLSLTTIIFLIFKISSLSKRVDSLTFENDFLSKTNRNYYNYSEPNPTETEESENSKIQSKLDTSYSLFLENGKLWLQTPKPQNKLMLIADEAEGKIVKFQMTSDFKYIFYLAQNDNGQFLYRYNTTLKNKIRVTDSNVDKFLISPNEKYIAYDKYIKVTPYSCCGNTTIKDTRPWPYIMPAGGGLEIKVKSPYTDENLFPCLWEGFTEEGYFVIFAEDILETQGMPFSIDFQGNYIKNLKESEILPLSYALTFPENVSNTYSVSELNGFPIYPNAEFTKILKYTPCVIEGISHQICNARIYEWETVDNFDQVDDWYRGGKSNSVWECSGGAGNYFGPLGSNAETSCSNGQYSYTVAYRNDNEKTTIFLEIPIPEK